MNFIVIFKNVNYLWWLYFKVLLGKSGLLHKSWKIHGQERVCPAEKQIVHTLTYGNGVSVKYDYNYANMLNTITNKNSAGSVISQYSYDYYLDGNQATKTDTDGTTMYKYDGLGRINTVEGPNSLFKKYGYDDKNNRTDLTATGEVFSDPEDSTFSYDGFNQLKSAAGNHNSTYTYNADGIRNTKVVDGVSTTQVLDGGNVAAEITGGTATKYVRGVNLISQEKNGQKYYYLYNGHGDVVQIADSAGNVVNNYDYDEWGNIKSQNEGVENPFKYSGEYFDKEIGLYYLRARYYDPTIGRFINEDSFPGKDNDPLSLNLYTYCYNNSINGHDPSGHYDDDDYIFEEYSDAVRADGTFDPEGLGTHEVLKEVDPKSYLEYYDPTNAEGEHNPRAGGYDATSTWGDSNTLQDHFYRHGGDFNASTSEEYAKMANDFYNNSAQYQVKVDDNGIMRVYDSETNTFGSFNQDGTTRSFFKPDDGQAYFDRQPGYSANP